MLARRASVSLVTLIVGCLLTMTVATNERNPGIAGDTSDAAVNAQNNVTTEQPAEDCPPRTHHVGLRYVIATFNFSHVQTPFIVAAWILFVTLAKIGIPNLRNLVEALYKRIF